MLATVAWPDSTSTIFKCLPHLFLLSRVDFFRFRGTIRGTTSSSYLTSITTSNSPPSSSMMPHHPPIPTKSLPFPLDRVLSSQIQPSTSPLFPPLLPTPHQLLQNLTIRNGDQPEYIHPYLIKSTPSTFCLSYPRCVATPSSIHQTFTPDLTISLSSSSSFPHHKVSDFDNFPITLRLPPSLRFNLVCGNPFLIFSTLSACPLPLHGHRLPLLQLHLHQALFASPTATLTSFTPHVP